MEFFVYFLGLEKDNRPHMVYQEQRPIQAFLEKRNLLSPRRTKQQKTRLCGNLVQREISSGKISLMEQKPFSLAWWPVEHLKLKLVLSKWK